MKMQTSVWLSALVLIVASHLSAAETVPAKYEIIQKKDIVDVLKADGHFTKFLSALDDAHLTPMLHEKGPFTVFAPTDDAFRKLLLMTALRQDQTRMISLVKNHIAVNHIYASQDLAALSSIRMLSGNSMKIAGSGPIWQISNAHGVAVNMEASNGIVHAIDAVLVTVDSNVASDPAHLPEPDDFVSGNF